MTEAMPFLQKYDITFLRPPTICRGRCFMQKNDKGRTSAPDVRPYRRKEDTMK